MRTLLISTLFALCMIDSSYGMEENDFTEDRIISKREIMLNGLTENEKKFLRKKFGEDFIFSIKSSREDEYLKDLGKSHESIKVQEEQVSLKPRLNKKERRKLKDDYKNDKKLINKKMLEKYIDY